MDINVLRGGLQDADKELAIAKAAAEKAVVAIDQAKRARCKRAEKAVAVALAEMRAALEDM